MNLAQLIHAFASDDKVRAIALLVVLDFVLGVLAALHRRDFRLGRVADFLRDDVLFKVVPYFALWVAVHVAGDLEIPGTQLGVVEEGAFLLVAGAMVASLVGSLRELGLLKSAPAALTDAAPPPGR